MLRAACLPAFSAWESVLPFKLQSEIISKARASFGYGQNPSFWVGAFERTDNLLERFAHDVFWFHISRLQLSQRELKSYGRGAGAEFWVQLRTDEQPQHERGMDWHFDKDEDLLDTKDIALTPTVGTVTYLSSAGAPLVVLSEPTLSGNGAGLKPLRGQEVVAYVTKPMLGRHVAFDGGLLHGCPAQLATAGERLSLVVNIWLEHRPYGVTKARGAACSMEGSSLIMHAAEDTIMPLERKAKDEAAAGAKALAVNFGPWRFSGLCLPHDLPLASGAGGRSSRSGSSAGQAELPAGPSGPWAVHHRCEDLRLELPLCQEPPGGAVMKRRHRRGYVRSRGKS